MGHPILVTGAPGNVSTEIVRLLREQGETVRAAVYNVAKARQVLGEGIEYAAFDFERPETYAAALQGVKRFYLMRPPQITDTRRLINPVIDAAKAAGVEQIVFLSLMGADKNKFVPHAKVEEHLLTAGVPYTLLRPTYFMQNLTSVYGNWIRQHGELPIPTGQGKTSWIDARDIAAVAARVLTSDGHGNKAYTLTGSEALSFGTVAQIMSEELGRPIRWQNPGYLEYRRKMKGAGLQAGLINITTIMYLIIRFGMSETLTSTTQDLLGRPPLTMRQFVRDHAGVWK
ncbi:MAG TPA: SDR family oxidoreductase [Symbiobacteriaceae bacterium]|nr:SDR family oxidoreductase [Symbiobacteriaceae bacterium]